MSSRSKGSVVLEDGVDEVEPVGGVVDVFGEFGLVGHGSVTSEGCGKFSTFLGCNRTELHNHRTLDGVDYSGKVYVNKVFWSCGKPSCPVCAKYGWAVREAGKIEARLAEASKLFGLVEHIVVSPSPRDYGLEFDSLRRKVIDVLRIRGVVGGVMIFHRDRYDRSRSFDKRWFVSPHFHVLGFVSGGYGRCRDCRKQFCSECVDGFEGKTRRENLKDGFIVKVLGRRKTVGGTAWYQLNHASYRIGAKRSNVATWFGVVSYRKLKVVVEVKRKVCPICQHDLEKLRYLGGNPNILACLGSRRRVGVREKLNFLADAFENGREVWSVVVNDGFGGCE